MAKWADYLISSVEKNSSGKIINVLLHPDTGTHVGSGVTKSGAEVITLLKRGYTVSTIIWHYPLWYQGAKVDYVNGANGEFLRTDRDKTAKDNLDNMIQM